MRRWARSTVTGIVTAVTGAVFALFPFSIELEEVTGLWWLFKARGAVEPPHEAVVVAIDGATGDALDLPKLPRDWPRTIHADLIRNLVANDAAVIVFDMDFSRVKEEDPAFAAAIAGANRVVLFERLVGKKQAFETSDGAVSGWTWVEEKVPPSEILAVSAKALGSFPLPKLGRTAFEFWSFKSSTGDAPTTVAIALQLYAMPLYERWLQLLSDAGVPHIDELPPNAAAVSEPADLYALMTTLRRAFMADETLGERLTAAIAASDLIRQDQKLLNALVSLYAGPSSRYLNLYGPPGTIARVPYQRVIKQAGNPVDLSGKVIFVGYSDLNDPEQPDRFYTVFTGEDGVDLGGVEIMASAFANLLSDAAIRPSPPMLTAAVTLFFGFVIGAAVYLLPALMGVGFAVAVSVTYAIVAQWLFTKSNLWLPLAVPILIQLPTAVVMGLISQYLVERRLERQMSKAISYYLPASLVRDLTERNLDPSSANRVVYGTCLATDMSGFTAIAEQKSPKDLAQFLNAYFDALAKVLKNRKADVIEFHADTIMCAWIGSATTTQTRENAALAAIDVLEAIEKFSLEDGTLNLNARIGLQDGQFYIGHTGGGGHLAYSILGDPANTAARLESLNKDLGTHVLSAQSVVGDLESRFLFRPLGSFRLMGKAEPLPVVEIMAEADSVTGDELELCARFIVAMDSLRSRRWEEARAQFESILRDYPNDGPSRFYLARAHRYAENVELHEDPTVIHLDHK